MLLLRRASSTFARRSTPIVRIAQPTAATHPHLMNDGELTPGIQASEYASRRARFGELLPEGCLALFPAASQAHMGHDVPFPYHQNSDLSYLSGFLEPSCLLVCLRPRGASTALWRLFVHPFDAAQAVWDGPRAGVEGAQQHILPDGDVLPIQQAPQTLSAALRTAGIHTMYCDGADAAVAGGGVAAAGVPGAMGMLSELKLGPLLTEARDRNVTLKRPQPLVHELRLRKSDDELALMRASASAASAAFRRTMCASAPEAVGGATEAVLAATFEYESRLRGAERLAYPCVVAGGSNAVTLHYMHNNARLTSGELLLMDAGASLHGYCSDITRTWPLSGRYSAAQRDVYSAVLEVNERCIDAVREGVSLSEIHQLSLKLTLSQLVQLGVLRADEPQLGARLQRYYPHAIGHWLGMDVHDTPSIGTQRKLERGNVVTVEPGLYFPLDDQSLPSWCRGIGIRIEDDVLVTGGEAQVNPPRAHA